MVGSSHARVSLGYLNPQIQPQILNTKQEDNFGQAGTKSIVNQAQGANVSRA